MFESTQLAKNDQGDSGSRHTHPSRCAGTGVETPAGEELDERRHKLFEPGPFIGFDGINFNPELLAA